MRSGISAHAAFNNALSRFLEELRSQRGASNPVLPDPGRATVDAESLDDEQVRRALADLPIEANAVAPAPPAGVRVRVRLAAEAAKRSQDAVLQQAARTLQARTTALRLCNTRP